MPGQKDEQKDRWKDEQTQFHRTFLATSKGPIGVTSLLT